MNRRRRRDPERVRDPIHGLITFENDEDHLVWDLLNTRAFQRLRRIKQLGFSDLVYPGATHSRLAHSLGVFYNARRLLKVIRRYLGKKYNDDRARAALCAALLHDIGHGPFSHTFEGVQKRLAKGRSHEQWSVAILSDDSEVHSVLETAGRDFPDEVASIVAAAEPADTYGAIVSSQFDADRLDYLVRDRYMTGVEVGHFDLEWLFDCLTVGEIYSTDEPGGSDVIPFQGLLLNHKGFDEAVGYIQARQQLYTTVYLHKTTRSAEKMLGALLELVARELGNSTAGALKVPASSPIVRFLKKPNPSVRDYLSLDDGCVWAFMEEARNSKHKMISELSERLIRRQLFKCVDVRARVTQRGSDEIPRFRRHLLEGANRMGLVHHVTLLEDDPKLSPYEWYNWDENTLKKVLVQDIEQKRNIDVGQQSDVIRALQTEEFFRVYVPDEGSRKKVDAIWKGVTS